MKKSWIKQIIIVFIVMMMFGINMSRSYAEDTPYSPETVFENHTSIMLILDAETGMILDANKAAIKFYGYTKEELLTMKISDINTLSEEQIDVEIENAVQEKRSYFEFKHRLKDGQIRDVEIYTSPAQNGDGKTILFSIVNDLTAKNQAAFIANRNKWIAIVSLSALTLVFLASSLYINLSKSKERKIRKTFKGLFESMNDAFAILEIQFNKVGDPVDYLFKEMNEAFTKTTIQNPEDIKNSVFWKGCFDRIIIDGETSEFIRFSEELGKYFSIKSYFITRHQLAVIIRDITSERNMLDKTEKERHLLESILEDALSGYWDWDVVTDKHYFSPAFKSMFGYDVDELEDSVNIWKKLLHKDDLKALWANLDVHIKSQGKIPFYNEVRFIHKDGSNVWALFSGRVVAWDQDKPARIVGCNINISSLKELEMQLKRERNLFKTTLHSIGDGMISTDKDGTINIMNNVAEDITGWRLNKAKGMPFDCVFYTVDTFTRENTDNPVEIVLKTTQTVEMDQHVRLIKKDGSEIPVEVNASPIFDDQGQVTGVVVVFRDNTEKQEKRERIEYLSYHDQLTGLYNRHFFEEELKRLDTERNLPFTIAMVDVNGLKLTNDVFGHEAGDMLLKCVAEALKNECRAEDIIARIGGDEFVILFPKTSVSESKDIIHRIYQGIEQFDCSNIIMSVSIGVETKDKKELNIREVFSRAEDQMYRKKLVESQEMRIRTIELIMETLHQKSPEEKEHSEKVERICKKLGEALKFDEESQAEIEMLGAMHDIGKIAISDEVLNETGLLSILEREEIKKHPEIGYQILKSADAYSSLANDVLSHHERWDGEGYPRGLKGEDISLMARILSIAEAYVAMISDRTYKPAMTHEEAIAEIIACVGTQFDPKLVTLMQSMDKAQL